MESFATFVPHNHINDLETRESFTTRMDWAVNAHRVLSTRGFDLFRLRHGQEPTSDSLIRDRDGRPVGAIVGTVFTSVGQRAGTPETPFIIFGDEGCHPNYERRFLKEYWGNFIGFVSTAEGTRVFTSPASMMPCFYIRLPEAWVIFSHLEDCRFIQNSPLTIDEDFLRQLLVYDKIQSKRTAIREIRELDGGVSLTIKNGGIRVEDIWDPREVASNVLELPTEDAAIRLRDTVSMCVRAWGSCYQHIATDLSGGFDSSVVLACLASSSSKHSLSANHLEAATGDASEAAYAHSMAESVGVPLSVIPLNPTRTLPDVETHPFTSRPYRHFLEGTSSDLTQTAMRAGADMRFSGQGGDHLFFAFRDSEIFDDFLAIRGLRPSAVECLTHAARLSGKSVADIVGTSIRRRARLPNVARQGAKRWHGQRDSGDALSTTVPEWASEPKDLPPGKFKQVAALPHLFQIRDPFPGPGPARVLHPLISLPLIETCLRIPTYTLAYRGITRGLARHAFQQMLPADVCWRESKGSVQNYFIDQLTYNREQITSALDDGELVSLGLIDPMSASRIFTDPKNICTADIRTLYTHYVIEAWVRTFQRK